MCDPVSPGDLILIETSPGAALGTAAGRLEVAAQSHSVMNRTVYKYAYSLYGRRQI